MRLAILGRILGYDGFGIQTALLGLLTGISELKPDHQIFLLIDKDSREIRGIPPGIEVVQVRPHARNALSTLYWDHIAVGMACKRLGIDVLYAPNHIRPLYAPCATLVCVHDMMYQLFPSDWPVFSGVYFRSAMKWLTSRSRMIVTVSKHTREDMIKILNIPVERTAVIHHGVPYGFYPRSGGEVVKICSKYELSSPFILSVGNQHPRKNLVGLLKGFESVKTTFPHSLVILGPSFGDRSTSSEIVRQVAASTRVKYLSLVPREDMPALFSAADFFVFPSLYEGFGLPVLEAMACGCPVLACRTSSIPEVAEDAALYVNPGDTRELAEALVRMSNDMNLRAELRSQGLARAAQFKWSDAARDFMKLVESVAGK